MQEKNYCVIIPVYNAGSLLKNTVYEVLSHKIFTIVVDDGSTDGCADFIVSDPGKTCLIKHPKNQGKSAALLTGLLYAQKSGFTHAISIDADGQHNVSDLPHFIEVSQQFPEAMILGEPMFDQNAPLIRLIGRKIANFFGNLETLWGGIQDTLCGFRLYPIESSCKILKNVKCRRFDVETQLVIRLYWQGHDPINIKTNVSYISKNNGGISHFSYFIDTVILIELHTKLLFLTLMQLPRLIKKKFIVRNLKKKNDRINKLCSFRALRRKIALILLSLLLLVSIYEMFLSHWWIANIFFQIFCGLLIVPTLIRNCSLFGKVITNFPTTKREIWLTIDDGPSPENTLDILDVLDRFEAKATFFVIGKKVVKWPHLIRQINERGHSVQNHTFNHQSYTFWMTSCRRAKKEIEKCNFAIQLQTGKIPTQFRVPVGLGNIFLHSAVDKYRLKMIGWSIPLYDGIYHNPDNLVKKLLKKLLPGSILLLHESEIPKLKKGIRTKSLISILEALKREGYATTIPCL